MESLKNKFNKFLTNIKVNKDKIIISYIICLTAFIIFLSIDQVTKSLLFEHGSVFEGKYDGDLFYVKLADERFVIAESIYPKESDQWINYKIIGIRSIWHGGVTFLKTRNQTFIQGLSILFLIVMPLTLLFNHKRYKLIGFIIGLVLAGTAGNMIDRFVFLGHVKDILFIPFVRDRGTFNAADVEIMLGIAIFVINTLFGSFRKREYQNIQDLVV
ncbi:signal peptidase II [Mycoplasmopsis edwardii]|uniref:Signal peptidase II n=1 Tax=Mycoplasmopsis edwardii TaxID=53558 RepID=A0ACD4PHZ1_9BACT|nr:signal peptidase II [Mycoplasmopsis edwardii]WBP84215.1 signal peptidase II [Mycoplasmopsis edwardii]